MTMSRRELIAAGAVASALATGGLSACSYPDIPNIDLPGRYFAAIALGRLVKAREWADDEISLAIVSTVGTQRFEGADDVGEAIFKLFKSEGFTMVGDEVDTPYGGMYWRNLGP